MLDRSAPYGVLTEYPDENPSEWTDAFWQGFLDRIDQDPTADSYTPVWTGDSGTQPSIGNGSITGSYTRKGSIVTVSISLTTGSTTTFGTGDGFLFTVPVTPVVANGPVVGFGLVWDYSAGSVASTLFPYMSGSKLSMVYPGTNLADAWGWFGRNTPVVLATSDFWILFAQYFGVAP